MIHHAPCASLVCLLSFICAAGYADDAPAAATTFTAPTQFTVESTVTDAQGVRHLRLFRDADRFRTETVVDGVLSETAPVVIERIDQAMTRLLLPETKIFKEHAYFPEEFPNPLKDPSAVWTKTGSEALGKVPCDVYSVVSHGKTWKAFVKSQDNQIVHIQTANKSTRMDFQRWRLVKPDKAIFEVPAGHRQEVLTNPMDPRTRDPLFAPPDSPNQGGPNGPPRGQGRPDGPPRTKGPAESPTPRH